MTRAGARDEKRSSRIGLALALLLIPVSLVLQVSYQDASSVDEQIRGDAARYVVTAFNLHHFGVYSDESATDRHTPPESRTDLSPGYPLFLAPFFGLASSREDLIERVLAVQVLLGSLIPFLTFLLARTQLGPGASWFAACLTALSPHLIAIGGYLLTDTLFTFALLLAMLAFVLSRSQPYGWLPLVAGALFGLAQLVREIGVAIPLFLAPLYFAVPARDTGASRRRSARNALLLLLGAGLVAVPQTILHERAIRGHPLREANDPWMLFVAGSDIDLVLESTPLTRDPEFERMKSDPAYGAAALRARIRAEPLAYLRWYLAGKAAFMWRWDNLYHGDVYQYPMIRRGFDEHLLLRAVRAPMRWIHAPLHALALLVAPLLFLFERRRGKTNDEVILLGLPLLAVCLYHALLLTILLPMPRYSIPLRPYVYVLAAMALARLAAWLRERRRAASS